MKNKFVYLGTILLCLNAGTVLMAQESASLCEADSCEPTWRSYGDALWLRRDLTSNLVLAEAQNAGAGQVDSLRSSALDFEFEPGVRIQVDRRLDCRTVLEGAYFGLHEWQAAARITNPDPANVQLFSFGLVGLGNAFPGSRISIARSTRLHNAEINSRRDFFAGACSGILGIRYVNLADKMTLRGEDALNFFSETTTIDADNHLIGPQLGGNWTLRHNRTSFDLFAKSGLFLNASSQDLRDVVDPNTVRASLSGDEVTLAGMIEVGITGRVELTRCFSIRGGYHVFHLSGAALAPDQIALLGDAAGTGIGPTDPSAGVENDGRILFHGFFVGIEGVL